MLQVTISIKADVLFNLAVLFSIIAFANCFLQKFYVKFIITDRRHLDLIKTPLIIYDSKSNKVLIPLIGEKSINESRHGNETSVRCRNQPTFPVPTNFKKLCKMNSITLV